MQDKNQLARYSGVLSEAVQESAGAPDRAQIKALMRKHRIWIEHSTLFEEDEPARELRAVQAEQHQFEAFVQDLIALSAPQAAPAAVAVPDGWKLVPIQVPSSAFLWVSGGYSADYKASDPRDQKVIDERAQSTWENILDSISPPALAATPAQSVVLPEHAAVVTFEWRKKPDVKWLIDTVVRGTKLYTEQQVRALLAGVSAPAAPTEQQILDAAEKAGLWPNTVQSWIPAFKRYHAALAAAPQAQAFQQRVQPWMMACFGPEISADRIERNHRFLEEALELVQSCGCTASEAHQLVDFVFGRDVGEPMQEAGGVMVTLAALCLANDLDMHACAETELARIWTKVEAIRAKQAAKPKHSPLPMHTSQTQDALRLAFVLSEIRRDGMDALSAALHDADGFPLEHQASVEAIDRAAIAAAKGE